MSIGLQFLVFSFVCIFITCVISVIMIITDDTPLEVYAFLSGKTKIEDSWL